MNFSEALVHVRANKKRSDLSQLRLHLAVGSTPGHLVTFITAHAANRSPERHVICTVGPYGDLIEALSCEAAAEAHTAIVVLEWPDIDPRLGLRRFASSEATIADMLSSSANRLAGILVAIKRQAAVTPVIVSLPGLPISSVFAAPHWQFSSAEASLRRQVLEFAEKCLSTSGVRVLNPSGLDKVASAEARHSVVGELGADMPYQVPYLSALSEALALAASPPTPMKGLITDLDDTFWRGLVGEVGHKAVSWSLESQSQIHAVYQHVLASLADQGVLLAIVSKNSPELAGPALARDDLLVPVEKFFPIEIGWGAKSEAVARILKRWNVGADSVAFVDDSAAELSEVQERFPDIVGLHFPTTDEAAFATLIRRLRDLFGRSVISADDTIRAASIRQTSEETVLGASVTEASASSIHNLKATLTFNFSPDPDDTRPVDLINKTNQFNLNGRRVEAADWKRTLRDPTKFSVSIGYVDKFGPLGTISVVSGYTNGSCATITTWVLSCRAFARRIEHVTLEVLAAHLGASEFSFDLIATEKNGPARTCLAELGADLSATPVMICPPLPLPFHERVIHGR